MIFITKNIDVGKILDFNLLEQYKWYKVNNHKDIVFVYLEGSTIVCVMKSGNITLVPKLSYKKEMFSYCCFRKVNELIMHYKYE